MELTVRIGDAPTKDQQIQDIDGEDLLNVKSYLRRRKYRLGGGGGWETYLRVQSKRLLSNLCILFRLF